MPRDRATGQDRRSNNAIRSGQMVVSQCCETGGEGVKITRNVIVWYNMNVTSEEVFICQRRPAILANASSDVTVRVGKRKDGGLLL